MENIIDVELPLIAEETYVFPIKTESQSHVNKMHEIKSDILLLTSEIGSKYPELYKHLDETPVAYNRTADEEITVTELENYLDSLDVQLYKYFDTHELNAMLFDFKF